MKLTQLCTAALLIHGVGLSRQADAGGTPLTVEKVATGLASPVYVTHAPGDTSRVFIVEQVGRVRILDLTQDPPVLQPVGTPFLNISGILVNGGERGLLGLAFHPDYATNGFFYVNYTRSGDGATVISRYSVTVGNPNDANEASADPLLIIAQPQANHNGGWIAFSPNDAYLYIAMGDGGGANDEGSGHTAATGNAQDTTANLLGKMLRIDVNSDAFPGDPNKDYAIPPTNPFAGNASDDEIWAYGLRNPWRDCFDSLTGDLYIADVGQGSWEEINFQPGSSAGGENWGWRCREGAHNFNFQAFCGPLTLLDPIHEYSHGAGCSVSGGEVYRGCAIPALEGTYFFADYCSTSIWSFIYTGGSVTAFTDRTAELEPAGADTINAVSSFGRDAEGEIYICDHSDGEVYKIVAVGGGLPCGPPTTPTAGDDVCVNTASAARGTTPCTQNADCPGGQVCGLKNRYITFNPSDGAYGLKVTCTASPDPTAIFQVNWVGTPGTYVDVPGPGGTNFNAAQLSCPFESHDFSHLTRLHVYGQMIMPDSAYTVEACESESGPCSGPLVIETAIWGDVGPPMGNAASQPDFGDIADVVDKFQNDIGAISKPRAQLDDDGVDPGAAVSFSDIATDVDAFQSDPYPYETTGCGG